MTTIVKAANAAEFLSLVPRLLGYHATREPRAGPVRGQAHARRDARRSARRDAGDGDVDCVAVDPHRHGVQGRRRRRRRRRRLHRRLVRRRRDPARATSRGRSRSRADACGLRVVDALCVAADAWGSYLDPECPPAGWPLAELGIEPDGLDGSPDRRSAISSSGSELPARRPRREGARRRRAARARRPRPAAVRSGDDAATRDAASVIRDGRDPASTRARSPRCARSTICPILFEEALDWDADALAPYDAATLIWCLSRPGAARHRAGRVVRRARRRRRGARRAAAVGGRRGVSRRTSRCTCGARASGPRPTRLRARRSSSRAALAAVAPRADARRDRSRPAAWLAWALGRSTHAERYAELACEIEPEHGLGEIVRSFVHAGHLPEWAFERPG